MEKDKLIINLIVCDYQSENYIFEFFKSLQKFNFIIQNFTECNFDKINYLFIFNKETSEKNINNIFSKIENLNNKNFLFLVHKNLNFINNTDYNILKFPDEITKIERQIKKFFFEGNFFYKNLLLTNSDILISKFNNNEVVLTEIESKILRLLFNHRSMSKKKMNFLALSQKADVESKSLESHLSRLRKKVLSLDKNIQINSDKGKIVKIV